MHFQKKCIFFALGIVVESPQGGTTEDLQRIARPLFRGNAQIQLLKLFLFLSTKNSLE
jgi:hypothetical protein